MKKIYFIIILLFPLISFSQGYKIEVEIEGIENDTLILGYYMKDQKFVKDSIVLDKNGKGVFKGEEKLFKGLYWLYNKKTFVDLLITENQVFSLKTKSKKPIENMSVKNSHQNEIFYKYSEFSFSKRKESQEIRKKYKDAKTKSDTTAIVESLKKINQEVEDYQKNILKENKNTFLNTFVKGTIAPEMPEVSAEQKEKNPFFQYIEYKKHFWDNINFSDVGILRTPFFYNKIVYFMDKVVQQRIDSMEFIIRDINELVKKAQADSNVFRFVLPVVLTHYEKSDKMGLDRMKVNLYETFYLSGQVPWADDEMLKKMKERSLRLKPNFIGNIAPDIKVVEYDCDLPNYIRHECEPISLLQIKAKYTILLFWTTDCSHCRTEVPKINEVYKELKKENIDVVVFSLSTMNPELNDDNTVNEEKTLKKREKWLNFIQKKDLYDWINVYDLYHFSNYRDLYDISSTPVIYLLDEKKEIIAKRIGHDVIKDFIHFLEKKDKTIK